jgi:IclR family transcriptional regulator, KDG regulon repressor
VPGQKKRRERDIKAIERQVAILDALGSAPTSGISITDLRLSTGLPVSTLHRTLDALQRHGVVVQEDTKKWRLGPRVAFWAGRYLDGPASLEPLRSFVRRLSRDTRFFAYLAIMDQGELVCIAVEQPQQKAHFFVQLGSRIPVLNAAAARALLAYQPPEIVRPLVERALFKDPKPLYGLTTLESYLEELEETRRRGYAKCMEELEVGVSALAVPIINARGRSVASMSVVAPTTTLVNEWDQAVDALRRASSEASMMLGRVGDQQDGHALPEYSR